MKAALDTLRSRKVRLNKAIDEGLGEFERYQNHPDLFASEVLHQSWSPDQIAYARSFVKSTRVACKGANAVGKTQGIAGIIIWFKLCFRPSIIITTAPSEDQVKKQIWQEIRKQIKSANEHGAGIDTRGLRPEDPYWSLGPLDYAKGLATNKNERFKGDHSEHMLIVLDEGPGVPPWAIDEAEGMCSADHNIIAVLGNPMVPAGPYYNLFLPKTSWSKVTLSALTHPNVTSGKNIIPGAVSLKRVEAAIKDHCELLDPNKEHEPTDFEWPRNSAMWYRPDNYFLWRMMGEFPREGAESLIPLYALEHAKYNEQAIDKSVPVDLGMDVAWKNTDYTVVYARRGPCVLKRWRWRGYDPEESSRKLAGIIKEYVLNGTPVGTVAIDAISGGAGVASRLRHMRDEGDIHCDRVLAVQVSERGANRELYSSIRAELAYSLAERFRSQQIDLSRVSNDIEDLQSDILAIEKTFDGRLKLDYSKKDDIRKKTGHSCDDFDAMCLCFMETKDTFAENYAMVMSAS